MISDSRIHTSLFLLRIGIAVVMLFWTIDKFVRPDHAAAVYETFYLISGLGTKVYYAIGIAELLIIIGFVIGFMKRFTYGAILLFHGISTLSSYKQYLAPFEGVNLLFFAGWPMLAACIVVYRLRHLDTFLAVEK